MGARAVVLAIGLVASYLKVSISAGSGRGVVDAFQNRICPVFGFDAQDSFLYGPLSELGGHILEHIDLVGTLFFCYIVAAQIDPSDGIGRIDDPLVERGNGGNQKRICIGLRFHFGGSIRSASAITMRISDIKGNGFRNQLFRYHIQAQLIHHLFCDDKPLPEGIVAH